MGLFLVVQMLGPIPLVRNGTFRIGTVEVGLVAIGMLAPVGVVPFLEQSQPSGLEWVLGIGLWEIRGLVLSCC